MSWEKAHALEDSGVPRHTHNAVPPLARSWMPIARRGIEGSQKLGQHRRLVERTFAWINRVRRLAI
jgi:hypothetical protein